jgi:type 1 glutamine amidotransferase
MLLATGAGLLVPSTLSSVLAQDKGKTKKVLFFTKSSGFQHSVITRKGDELSLAERVLTDLGKENGFEVIASKDGRLFNPDQIGQWDAFAFETTGDLTKAGTDKTPPMTPEGEQAFYDAIKAGKGFMGMHCATDTFGHHRGKGADDPYIQMIGGEFAGHGAQQKATLTIADPAFPGAKAFGTGSFEITDEWYGQKNIADDLRVIFVQNTSGMQGRDYQRPNYPQTWARMHGKGRVFYTSMGHREDVWENSKYQQLLTNALSWVTGKVEADVAPNITKVTPEYQKLPA